MKTKLLLVIMGAVLSSPVPSPAADGTGAYNSAFPEKEGNCGTFIAARDEARRGDQFRTSKYLDWLTGYITAYNRLKPDTFDIVGQTDKGSWLSWLENYCKAHPLDSFSAAVAGLTDTLYPNRVKVAPKE